MNLREQIEEIISGIVICTWSQDQAKETVDEILDICKPKMLENKELRRKIEGVLYGRFLEGTKLLEATNELVLLYPVKNKSQKISVGKIQKTLLLPLSDLEKELIRWINEQINNGVNLYKEENTTKQEQIEKALYSCYNTLDNDELEKHTNKIYKEHVDKILKIFKEE